MQQCRFSILYTLLFILFIFLPETVHAQFVPVGQGGYTTAFPGVDAAGRNSYPSGTPQVTGAAAGRPVPTNDWWAGLLSRDHVNNLFNYPMALKTTRAGLVVSYIPWGVYDDQEPIVAGVSGLDAAQAKVADYSDWTVTIGWNNGSHGLRATTGTGMPFVYFTKEAGDVAQVTVNLGTVTVSGEMLVVANARNGADFAIYAPEGSTWTQSGKVYSSTLNGKNYWSIAMIPLDAADIHAVAEEYRQYAYVFPTNTTASYSFDEASSVVRTDFVVETEVMEGTAGDMLLGLLPHQWDRLAAGSPQPGGYSYSTVRGELKTLAGNGFSVADTFYGILPTLPYLDFLSEGFNPAELGRKTALLENDALASWTDSYNEGQVMNRLIQTARIADETGNIAARDKMIATIEERLEDWLLAEAGEVAFLFYYNSTWSALIGYPAGHGQDGNLNDHHFHWGYFIHAAAFMEQYAPGWAGEWGEMVDLLVRDAASPDRDDPLFPYLRNFSPYAGHCWANGFATFPQGIDQESASESMQFNSSLIHWGTITGNDAIRDLGIYLYCTEQAAIEEYWFDVHERNFGPSQQYSLVSRVWGNSYDNGTFWTNDIAASYGIEMYPIHGGSLYLGRDTAYVQKLWNEIASNTGILSNEANPNLWHDVFWKYLAFVDPRAAIDLYDSYPGRSLKFGISDAQTYYWLHAMDALGRVSGEITADYPVAAVFDKGGDLTYVAHNYSAADRDVSFSDGTVLHVPAKSMATSKDVGVTGTISADFSQAYSYGSVNLTVDVSGGGVSAVEFFDGTVSLGTDTEAPYAVKASNLSPGMHGMYALVYVDGLPGITNVISIQVGEQVPYFEDPFPVPGTIEAGHYDRFEGGTGQGIAYVDASVVNEGGFRPNEYVDAVDEAQEGATVGWITAGEWLEYGIEVETAGLYDLSFRYASGNANGGGPFHFEIDGRRVSDDFSMAGTGDWDAWVSKTVQDIELNRGSQVLRLVISEGEFNLGRMTFSYSGPLPYSPPVADAGANVVVVLPATTGTLDGSLSSHPLGAPLDYLWEQVYGPSVIVFSESSAVSPDISNLEEGIYKCRLTVSDGSYSSQSTVLVIVSNTANISPTVTLSSPAGQARYYVGSVITLEASAKDLDGSIVLVEFFDGGQKIGEDSEAPFSFAWEGAGEGSHTLTARATDNGGETAVSAPVDIEVMPAPSCTGEAENGDYSYRFSDEMSNPTLTFIPQGGNAGNPTCILYYGKSAPFPGYPVTPNIPYRINADEGELIYFYYTYSYNGSERTTLDSKHSYVVGSCYAGTEPATLTLSDTLFRIDENSAQGTVLGRPDFSYTGSRILTFRITGGNEAGGFRINAQTGVLSVAKAAALNYEVTPSFTLLVELSDGTLSDEASVTVELNDLVETLTVQVEESGAPLVYPNPARDRLYIRWDSFASATLTDLSGRRVIESTELEMEIAHLPAGVYILQLRGRPDQRSLLRVVKL